MGGIFPVHFFGGKEYVYNIAGLAWVEAMMFSIDEINNRSDILENVTLGYRIFDSCNRISYATKAALQLLNGNSLKYTTKDACPCTPFYSPVIGLVGDAASATTTKVASLMSASRTPQISHSSTSTYLRDKVLYPSLLRTIPPDNYQANLITDLMLHFEWRYINVVACDDLYGRVGVDELRPQLKHNNICTSVFEIFDVKNDNGDKIRRVVQSLKAEKNASVIVLWCQKPEALRVLRMAEQEQLYHRTWIATETYGPGKEVYEFNHNVVKGMFGIVPARRHHVPFTEYLRTKTPNSPTQNPWTDEYWIKKRFCNRTTMYNEVAKYVCQNLNTNLSDLAKNTHKFVNVINSVYAIAYALDSYLKDNNNNTSVNKLHDDMMTFNKYVREVNFIGKSNVNISFNEQGDPMQVMYSINNLQYNTTSKQLRHRIIADWKYPQKTFEFLHSDKQHGIQFSKDSDVIPTSSCAQFCTPGYYALDFGNKPCCWKCVKCSDGEIQPIAGQHSCIECEHGEMPNKNHTLCLTPTLLQINTSDLAGYVIIIITVVGYIFIFSCLVIFLVKRHTPIVKSSNRSLSLLQIISMMFQLGLPAFYIQSDFNAIQCAATLYYYIFFNTITISVTFTKAHRLLKVFHSASVGILAKNSRIRGNSFQYAMVFLLTIFGLVVCTTLIAIFTPEIKRVINYKANDIEVVSYCAGNYSLKLFVLIGYVVIISLVCSIYAFKARKLPHNYNEARYTSFAMFTFLLVWTMAVPIYFSSSNEIDRYASLCILNFVSTMVIFTPMYLPKMYVIVFQPKENTVARFRENLTASSMVTVIK